MCQKISWMLKDSALCSSNILEKILLLDEVGLLKGRSDVEEGNSSIY